MNCHPDRSEAKWRDLLFSQSASNQSSMKPLTLLFSKRASKHARCAIPALDHRQGRESPAAASALREHGANSPEYGSTWKTCRAWSRPEHHPQPADSATSGCLPSISPGLASAASLLGEFATTTRGIFVRGVFFAGFAREGATRGASPSILRKCGGHGASPRPADSSFSASSSNPSSEPCASSMPACGSPISAKRAGTVSTVKSAGSQSGTSCQWSGVETRASGSGRTEYAEQVVRSFAFWL